MLLNDSELIENLKSASDKELAQLIKIALTKGQDGFHMKDIAEFLNEFLTP